MNKIPAPNQNAVPSIVLHPSPETLVFVPMARTVGAYSFLDVRHNQNAQNDGVYVMTPLTRIPFPISQFKGEPNSAFSLQFDVDKKNENMVNFVNDVSLYCSRVADLVSFASDSANDDPFAFRKFLDFSKGPETPDSVMRYVMVDPFPPNKDKNGVVSDINRCGFRASIPKNSVSKIQVFENESNVAVGTADVLLKEAVKGGRCGRVLLKILGWSCCKGKLSIKFGLVQIRIITNPELFPPNFSQGGIIDYEIPDIMQMV